MPPRRDQGVYLYVQVRIAGQIQPMLVPRMLKQIPVGDRSFMLRKYQKCFTGTDAVKFFLSKRFARSEYEAVAIGNALLKAGVFRHVRNEHLFRSGNYFYRFAAHEDYVADHESINLRASRIMSVACNSFMRVPEISAADTENFLSISNISDATLLSADESLFAENRPEFDEVDILVEMGIRIGKQFFPNLVTKFTHAKDLVRTHSVRGKILERSFNGKAAIKWLIRRRYAQTVAEAVNIGNAMLSSGVFYPLETDHGGFGYNLTHYRMMADTDISKELKRGARKDMFLRLLGVDRGRAGQGPQEQQSPWFEDQISFSFTSTDGSKRWKLSTYFGLQLLVKCTVTYN